MTKITFDFYKMGKIINTLLNSNITYHRKGSEGKVRPITKAANTIKRLDCSGFVDYVIYQTSVGNKRLKAGGTSTQRGEISKGGYAISSYDRKGAGKMDGIVRIAFKKNEYTRMPVLNKPGKTKVERTEIGHVWLIINGKTFDTTTKGTANGPTSFHWSERISSCTGGCFILGPLVVPNCPQPLDYYLSLAAEKHSIIGSFFKILRTDHTLEQHSKQHHQNAPLSHEKIGPPAKWEHYKMNNPIQKKKKTKSRSPSSLINF
ncbi:MAG: hypothetical protein KAH03_03130 [Cocleimonas sp.]|nr:hypothetical protein [Cocleimonas sp.]